MPDGFTTKHGMLAGDAAPPHRADWTIEQNWECYTAAEHATWKTLYERQAKLLPGRACAEFLAGLKDLAIGADAIPDFRRLSDVLMRRTGWQVVAVPGLVPPKYFSSISRTGASRPGNSFGGPTSSTTSRSPTSSTMSSVMCRC
jgi:phenylalanine-4-hydroxylase